MARNKTITRKLRLGKQNRRTRWAPFWIIPKSQGPGKRVHPSRLTRIKRNWRKNKIQEDVKASKKHNFRSGRIRKQY